MKDRIKKILNEIEPVLEKLLTNQKERKIKDTLNCICDWERTTKLAKSSMDDITKIILLNAHEELVKNNKLYIKKKSKENAIAAKKAFKKKEETWVYQELSY